MPVWTAVAREAGVHQPQTAQKFCSGAESTADPRDAGTLAERQGGGDIEDRIGIGRRLPAINIIKNNVHNVAGLDQDWAFGFCATSRGDSYWFSAE